MNEPIEADCDCYTCTNFTASYLSHLFRAKELLSYIQSYAGETPKNIVVRVEINNDHVYLYELCYQPQKKSWDIYRVESIIYVCV